MPLLPTWERQMAVFVVAERIFNLILKLWFTLQLSLHENFYTSSLPRIRSLTRPFWPLDSSLITPNLIVPMMNLKGSERKQSSPNLEIKPEFARRDWGKPRKISVTLLVASRPKFEPGTSWVQPVMIATTRCHKSTVLVASCTYRLGAGFAPNRDYDFCFFQQDWHIITVLSAFRAVPKQTNEFSNLEDDRHLCTFR
jgi:hypothetical protein